MPCFAIGWGNRLFIFVKIIKLVVYDANNIIMMSKPHPFRTRLMYERKYRVVYLYNIIVYNTKHGIAICEV